MPRNFDIVVIGSGSAASAVAFRCRAAGRNMAIIDVRPFGGTCALRGCDPKKVLVGAAETLDRARRGEGSGVAAESLRLVWRDLMRFKRTFTTPVPAQREEKFTQAGVVALHGQARFIGPSTVQVGEEVLEGRYVVIASGQTPAHLGIPGEELLTTSEAFLDLDELPRRIVFVGGGYIAMEFAHIAARAGARVTILHRDRQPLPRFDPGLVGQLVARTRELGVTVELETEVTAVEARQGQLFVHAGAAERARGWEADMVVHAAGRVADIDGMNLAAAGVEWGRHGVKVNEYLQSVSNPKVYAAGDAAASGGPPLTPVAGYEGAIVAENVLGGNCVRPSYHAIPTVVFTIPPLAAVGLTEQEARDQGFKFVAHTAATADWYSSRRVGEKFSGYNVLVEAGTDYILGAHLLGDQAEETINLFALAMRSGLRAAELQKTLFSYPTHGSDVQYML